MLDERMEAQAASQRGMITHDQALRLGLTESAVRHRRNTGWLSAVRPRVYALPGAVDSAEFRAMSAVLAAGPGTFLSHESAAGLHGVPGFNVEPLTVSVIRRRRRLPQVRVEQSLYLPLDHCTAVDGIPCTTVARTLFDLCGGVNALRAERALDSALARKLVTLPLLWKVSNDLAERGRAGTVVMRSLLVEREPDYVAPESELESRFIELTRQFGLPVPERQVDLGDGDGWIGRVDFLFRGKRLVVEVDGAAFHDSLVDRRHDEQRDARLKRAGWDVLRFSWDAVVNHGAAVAREIRFRGPSASP